LAASGGMGPAKWFHLDCCPSGIVDASLSHRVVLSLRRDSDDSKDDQFCGDANDGIKKEAPVRQGDTPLIRVLIIHDVSGLGRVLDQLGDPAVHLGTQIRRESAASSGPRE
jgi:hypothetical protein